MQGTLVEGKISDDIVEYIGFVIKGNEEPPELICLPELESHSFTLEVNQVRNLFIKCN